MTTVTRGWAAYLLRCADGTYYAGSTNDLARRLREHHAGTGGRYTRGRRPIEWVWACPCNSRSQAQRLEALLKRLPHQAKEELAGYE